AAGANTRPQSPRWRFGQLWRDEDQRERMFGAAGLRFDPPLVNDYPLPITHPNRGRRALLIYVNHLRRRKAVEPGRGGVAVSADVLAVEQVAQFEVAGQLLRHGDHVERVAGGAEHGADLRRTALEGLEVVVAMVEDDAGEGVIDAVVDIVTELPIAHGLAEYPGDGEGGGGDHEPARLGEYLDVLLKQAGELAVDERRQLAEGLDAVVIGGGET